MLKVFYDVICIGFGLLMLAATTTLGDWGPNFVLGMTFFRFLKVKERATDPAAIICCFVYELVIFLLRSSAMAFRKSIV